MFVYYSEYYLQWSPIDYNHFHQNKQVVASRTIVFQLHLSRLDLSLLAVIRFDSFVE